MLKNLNRAQMADTVGGALSRTPAGTTVFDGSPQVIYVDEDGNVVCGYPPKKDTLRLNRDTLTLKG